MNTNSAATALVILTYLATSIFGTSMGKAQNSDSPNVSNNSAPAITEQATSGSANSNNSQVTSMDRSAAINFSANMRTGPGTSYNVSQKVEANSTVAVVGESNDWYQIKTKDGTYGWIHGSLLNISNEPANLNNENGVNSSHPTNGYDYTVVGYYIEDYATDKSSYNVVKSYGSSLTAISPFSYTIDKSGNVTGTHSTNAATLANEKNLSNLALIHNIVNGKFNKEAVSALLNSSTARTRGVNNILKLVQANGYDGVNIDFEDVPPADRAVLTKFMEELYKALKAKGYLVTMSVPAKTSNSPNSTWSGAFDYYELGKNCDYIMLMTYDEHVSGGAAGPVASYNWVESVLKYATTQISKKKILLGIPGYGYDWNTSTHKAKAVTFSKALSTAEQYGVKPTFDSTSKAYTYTYTVSGVKRVVWFENAETLKYKISLVKKYGVGGLAIWRLGLEDTAYWKVIKDELLK